MNNRTCQFSKILGVVDGGSISKWVGKPLDQIDVDVNDGQGGQIQIIDNISCFYSMVKLVP